MDISSLASDTATCERAFLLETFDECGCATKGSETNVRESARCSGGEAAKPIARVDIAHRIPKFSTSEDPITCIRIVYTANANARIQETNISY